MERRTIYGVAVAKLNKFVQIDGWNFRKYESHDVIVSESERATLMAELSALKRKGMIADYRVARKLSGIPYPQYMMQLLGEIKRKK